MLTLPQALSDYFRGHFGTIKNTYGILFAYYRGVSVECPLPGYKQPPGEAMLHLVVASPSLADFIHDFSLRSVTDVYKITRQWMADRYKKGKAEICCMLNDYHARTLYFRLDGDAMFSRDAAGRVRRLPIVLATAPEIIKYTQKNA